MGGREWTRIARSPSSAAGSPAARRPGSSRAAASRVDPRDAPRGAHAGAPDRRLAELVCSNSLKSDAPDTPPCLLKEELRRLGSLLMEVAEGCRVPAGQALAVDRDAFAGRITAALEAEPRISIERREETAVRRSGR